MTDDNKPRHWITTIPVVAVISAAGFMAYQAGQVVTEVRSQGQAMREFATEVKTSMSEARKSIRELEDWRTVHEAKSESAAAAVRRRP